MNENIYKTIATISTQIDNDFWKRFVKETKGFPDTEDAGQIEIYIVVTSIVLIATKFLHQFTKNLREEQVEYLFESIRINLDTMPE